MLQGRADLRELQRLRSQRRHRLRLHSPTPPAGLPPRAAPHPHPRAPVAAMAGFTMEDSCCFWLLARTTMRTVRAGCAARAVVAPVKHALERSIVEHAIFASCECLTTGQGCHSVVTKGGAARAGAAPELRPVRGGED
jgi:hypothetical protein